tara:strand:+ start:11196 stop:12653 length:1458 start_codon:yes stop_codon:yes gene_type:complete
MSDIAILSAENSSLMNSALQGSGGANNDALVYTMEAPLPNHFRSRDNKSQILGAAMGGNSYQVEVPAYGNWKSAYLRWNVDWTPGTDNCTSAVAANMGCAMIKRVSVLSNSRTLFSLTGQQIHYLIQSEKDAQKRAGWKRASRDNVKQNCRSSTAGTAGVGCPPRFGAAPNGNTGFIATDAETAVTIDVYTPLPFSMFNSLKTMLPTDFCEKLIIEIETNDHWRVVSGGSGGNTDLAVDFNVNSCYLCSEFLVINNDDKRKIQEKNYSLGGSPLAMLLTDWKTTSKQVAGVATRTTATLNVFFTELMAGMLIYVEPNRTSALIAAVGETGKSADQTTALGVYGNQIVDRGVAGVNVEHTYAHVENVKISAGGRKIIELKHDEILYLHGSRPSGLYVEENKETAEECDSFGNSPHNLYYINFANTHALDKISGALALRSLNSVVVEVTFQSVDTASLKYNVNACMQYFKAIQIDGSSGNIATALSN